MIHDGSISITPSEAELRKQIAAFRRWADQYWSGQKCKWEHGHGEWECNYSQWPEIWSATVAFLETGSPALWDDEIVEEILYILARDNEDERIKEEIVRRPSCLLALAKRGLSSTEVDARWQLADALGAAAGPDTEVEPLLVSFYNDSDEYVSRRALLAMGSRSSEQAEASALQSWNTGHEYQQMAALCVLSRIGSAHFESLRHMVELDPRQYLAKAARAQAVPESTAVAPAYQKAVD